MSIQEREMQSDWFIREVKRGESPAAAHIPSRRDPLVALCGARLIGVDAGKQPPNTCGVCKDLWVAARG